MIMDKNEFNLQNEFNLLKEELNFLKTIDKNFIINLHYGPNKSLKFNHLSGLEIISFIPTRPMHLDSGVDLQFFINSINNWSVNMSISDSNLFVECSFFKTKEKNIEFSNMLRQHILKNKYFITSNSFKKTINKLTNILFDNNYSQNSHSIHFDFNDYKSSFDLMALNYDIISIENNSKKRFNIKKK